MAQGPASYYEYPLHKAASALGLSPQAESFLQNVARQTAIKMSAYQQEWNVEKMKGKLIEYLNKAAKAVGGAASQRNWEKMIEDFSYRFIEAFWAALGDQDWLDRVDVNDLTACVQTSIIGYFPKSDLATVVNDPKYSKACQEYTERAFDDSRYACWGWSVFKETLSGKVAQKKVGLACDAAREKVVKERPDSPEIFVRRWVKLSIDELAKGNDINSLMSEMEAIKLFNHLVQKAAVPTYLLRLSGGKPPSNCNEISDIVEEAYKAHPPPPRKASPSAPAGKGFGSAGKDSGSWQGVWASGNNGGASSWGNNSWGGDSWGSDPGSWDMMMNMMNMMMGGKGGCGGCSGGFDGGCGKGGCDGLGCGFGAGFDGSCGKGGCDGLGGSFGGGCCGKGGCDGLGGGFGGACGGMGGCDSSSGCFIGGGCGAKGGCGSFQGKGYSPY